MSFLVNPQGVFNYPVALPTENYCVTNKRWLYRPLDCIIFLPRFSSVVIIYESHVWWTRKKSRCKLSMPLIHPVVSMIYRSFPINQWSRVPVACLRSFLVFACRWYKAHLSSAWLRRPLQHHASYARRQAIRIRTSTDAKLRVDFDARPKFQQTSLYALPQASSESHRRCLRYRALYLFSTHLFFACLLFAI